MNKGFQYKKVPCTITQLIRYVMLSTVLHCLFCKVQLFQERLWSMSTWSWWRGAEARGWSPRSRRASRTSTWPARPTPTTPSSIRPSRWLRDRDRWSEACRRWENPILVLFLGPFEEHFLEKFFCGYCWNKTQKNFSPAFVLLGNILYVVETRK